MGDWAAVWIAAIGEVNRPWPHPLAVAGLPDETGWLVRGKRHLLVAATRLSIAK